MHVYILLNIYIISLKQKFKEQSVISIFQALCFL